MAVIIGTPAPNPPPSLVGTPSDDIIYGLGGDDRLDGRDGNDTTIGGPGDDTILGGRGDDLNIWNDGDGSDSFNGDAGVDTQRVNGSAAAGDTFLIGEREMFSGSAFQRVNLVPFQLSLPNVEIVEVNGRGGNDSLTIDFAPFSVASILFNGGDGSDILNATNAAIGITASGGPGADTLNGGYLNDRLDGGAGNDALAGGRGNDILYGGAGDDQHTWNDGDGSDVFDGGAGSDLQRANGSPDVGDYFGISASGGMAVLNRSNPPPTNLEPSMLNLISVERLEVNGLGGDDVLGIGDTAVLSVTSVVFNGGAGDDTLEAYSATMPITAYGGDDDDKLRGSGNSDVLSGESGSDMIWGNGCDDRLFGGPGNDHLFGGMGNDDLQGGPGRDVLRGNLGDDLMVGGGGGDSFVYQILTDGRGGSGGDGNDTVPDFERFIDRLVLDAFDEGFYGDEPIVISDDGGNVIVSFNGGGGQITLLGLGNGTIDTVQEARLAGIDILVA